MSFKILFKLSCFQNSGNFFWQNIVNEESLSVIVILCTLIKSQAKSVLIKQLYVWKPELEWFHGTSMSDIRFFPADQLKNA